MSQKTKVPAIPAPTDANLRDVARAVKGLLDVREGLQGDPLDKSVTFRDLVDGGLADAVVVNRGGGSGAISMVPAPGIGSGSGVVAPDLTPPPAPTGLQATAGIAVIILEWDAASYGNHAFTEIWRAQANVIGDAVRIGTAEASMYTDPLGVTGALRYYWVRHRSTADVAGPYSSTDGVSATTGKIGNVDLGPLIVEAGNLAGGAVSAAKLAAGAVGLTSFASGIEPVTVVAGSTVPTVKSTSTIFLAGTGKLYRWTGTAYVTSVSTSDLAGTIADAQIAGLAASKVTGQLTDSQIAAVAAAKLTGQVVASQVADAALTTAKFAAGIEPVTVVTGTLPTAKSTSTIFRTDDAKTYRWSGSAYIATVATSDLSGTVTNAQIAGLAASKVTGQFTDAQVADLAAAKLTGTISSSQIAAGAISVAKFASGIEPVTVVTGTLPTTKSTNQIFRTDDSKLYRWSGSAYVATVASADISGTITDAQLAGLAASKITGQLTNTQIADLAAAKLTGQVASSQITDGSISGSKFASGLEPVTVVSSVPVVKSTSAIFNTADGKLYRWSGTIYVATIPTADLSGTVTDAQIAGLAAAKVTGQLAASQLNVQVGGGNLLLNSSFEVDTNADGVADSWTVFAGGAGDVGRVHTTSLVAAAPGVLGSFAQRLLIGATGNANDSVIASSPNSPVAAGQQYGVSAHVRSNVAGKVYLIVRFLNSVGGSLGDQTSGFLATANAWARLSFVPTAPAGSVTATIMVRGINLTGEWMEVDGFQAEPGNLITAYAPRPAEILPGAVASTQIADNAITAPKILAGAIVAGKIAANAVTATEIAAATITGGKIAAGTITGSNIAADTITAGQIAAGAITASEVSASAITTDKLFVTGRGSALNDDPSVSDISAWQIVSGPAPTIQTVSDPAAGRTTLRGTNSAWVISRQFSVDVNKRYRLRCWVRGDGTATGSFWLRTQWFNGSGVEIGISTTAPVTAHTSTWVRLDSGNVAPSAGAASARLLLIFNYSGSTGYHEVQDVQFEDAVSAELIVDGAISAIKIAAGSVTTAKLATAAVTANEIAADSVTAAKILAGSVTTAKIAAGAVTASEVAAGAITTGKLAASAVTANELAANAVTAGKISAGAVTAAQISAGAITASKLAVADLTNMLPDAEMNDDAAWAVSGGTLAWEAPPSTAWRGARVARIDGSAGSYAILFSRNFPVEAGGTMLLAAQGQVLAGAGTFGAQVRMSALPDMSSASYAGVVPSSSATLANLSLPFTVPAGMKYGRIEIFKNNDPATSVRIGGLILRRTASAELIVDGAVIASKVAAGAITTAKIAAGAVTAGEIAADAVTAVKILAGSITTAKIAAGAVTANEIAAATITGGKIAAGTITASNIAADTITAGQIAAGAVSASEIAAGAITTSKLLVTGAGAALNSDPSFLDASAWMALVGGYSIVTLTDGKVGTQAIRSTTGVPAYATEAKPVPFDPSKLYRVRMWARSSGTTPNGTLRLAVRVVDSAGVNVTNGVSTYWYLQLNLTPGTAWTEYTGTMGTGGTYAFPANGVAMAPIALLNVSGTVGYHEIQDFRIEEAVPGSLIVDGSITAAKILAGTITATQIAADTITASQIAANAITASELAAGAVIAGKITAGSIQAVDIAAATITGGKIAAGTITASNIAADTITAGQIAAGAISATKIAAGAIAVGTAAIQNGAIVNAMLGTAVVDSAKIADAAITTAKIGDAQITNAKISTLDASKITAGTISADRIGAESITAAKIDSRSLSIKDASGNIILSAGSTLPESYTAQSNFQADRLWNFNSSIEGWTGGGTNTPVQGATAITLVANHADPIFYSPTLAINGTVYNKIRVRLRRTAGAASAFECYFIGTGTPAFIGTKYKGLPASTVPINEWFVAEFDMANLTAGGTAWTSATITQIRLDFGAAIGDTYEIDWVAIGAYLPSGYGAEFGRNISGQITSSNVSSFVGADAIGITQIGTVLQTTNYSSTAGWQITKAGAATFNNVSLRGALNGGSFTSYAWPASGTGFHVGPNGILLGNYNVVLSNGKRAYLELNANGNIYAPGFQIVDGDAYFGGTLSASIVNTDQIIGGAVSVPVVASSTGSSVSVTVYVPAGASAILIDFYLGPPTATTTGGGSGKDGYTDGSTTFGPALAGLTYDGVTTGSVIVAPAAGSHTITVSRSYYTLTARLRVVVLKR